MKMTRRIALLTIVATLGLVGCGGDDDDSTVANDKTTTTEGGGDSADGDVETYCAKSAEIEATLSPGPDIDFESASEEEIATAMKDFAAGGVDLGNEALEAAPAEIHDTIEILVNALKTVAETGDPSSFENEENEAASKTAHAFDLENCEWEQVDVSAVNYEFKGIPDELEAGVTSFEFSNDGTELHEMILLRKNDDVTETWDELLALPEEEARPKTTSVGSAFAKPGEDAYAVADLEPGEYIALCFIPVGSVDEDTHAEGPPHFTQGMKHEFSVS